MVAPAPNLDQLALYDQAVKDFCQQFLISNPAGGSGYVNLPAVYATPERAFGEMREILKRQTGETAERVKLTPYPFASFYRTPPALFDPTRHNAGDFGSWLGFVGHAFPVTQSAGTTDGSSTAYAFSLGADLVAGSITVVVGGTSAADNGQGGFSGTGVTGTVVYTTGDISLTYNSAPAAGIDISATYRHTRAEEMYAGQFPYPYDFHYTIDFWTRYRKTQNEIVQQLMVGVGTLANTFNPFETFLSVDFGAPWGVKYIPATDYTWSDNSTLETDEVDRILRLTLDMTLKGWLFVRSGIYYPIRQVVTEIFFQDPGENGLGNPVPPPAESLTITDES